MKSFAYAFEGRDCRVTIGAGALGRGGPAIGRSNLGGKALVVSDSNVAPLYGEGVLEGLTEAGLDGRLCVLPAGEGSKSLDGLQNLWDELAAMRLGRDGFLVAVGGGVISDLTGFAAATWLRGVDWVICPTSLEAAVDASIGGKTAVNHPAGKNLLGAFHQPVEVVVDPLCLRTLPERDLRAGLAESIKHALIEDPDFVCWHESNRDAILQREPATMECLIERNVTIKAGIVAQDVRERSGIRARLNFGHTLGHAVEAACGWALRHGECVALGMVAAARMSHRLGLLPAESCNRAESLIRSYGLPVRYDHLPPYETLAPFIAGDKKVSAARTRWVLLTGLGSTVIRDDVDESLIRRAADSLR